MVLVSTQDVIYTIKEEIPVHTLIGNIGKDTSVVDRVSPDNLNTLRYSILTTGNPSAKLFAISSSQGNLTSAARIDRETLCPFTSVCALMLEVAVRSETSFFSYKVKITIEDTNDNRPTFPARSVNLEIPESSQVGVSFSFDGAVDNDTENNAIGSYLLFPDNVPFGVDFTKNLDGTSTVSVVVKEELDREKNEFYFLTLFAKDGGSPQKNGSMLVNISILDSNDNAPQFTYPVYNVTVQENTPINTAFLKVKATDKDAGNNSEIFYRLSLHQPKEHLQYFLVDKTSGDMKLQVAPPSGHIRVIVEASDRGKPPKVAQAFVDITVLDTENQSPSITVNLFNGISKAHISEFKKPGYAFAHVRISDPDTGRNGNVTCHSQTVDFALKRLNVKEYTVIVASNLDRETSSTYTVVIFCEDDGEPKLNTSATFDVEIDDENDNAPKFLQSVYNISIPENNAVNDTILQVAATDKDTGANSHIMYKISEEGLPFFFIPFGSSVVRVKHSFDREKHSHYSFRVLAVDGGVPRLTSTAQVEITVIDLNDERPVFTEESYTFYIAENSPLDTIVGDVSATDGDTGTGGTFSLVLSSSYKSQPLPFTVLQNGTIITTGVLDAESEVVYKFQVIATDHAVRPLSGAANIQVIVTDQNEHEPYFLFPNNINNSIIVFAPHRYGKAVLWVQAYDDDVEDAENLQYSLVDKNSSGIFKINSSTGQIILKRDIGENHVGYYELEITASDKHENPRSHTETLRVFIKYKVQEVSEGDHYVIIVIAIVCVTVIVAAAVLVTLCYLRKHDKDQELKRSFSTRSEQSKHQVPVLCAVDGCENIKTQLQDLKVKPTLKDVHADKSGNMSANHEMYRSNTFTDLSQRNRKSDGHQQTLHQIRLSQSAHKQDTLPENVNGRFWIDGLKQAEDFHSSSSGEVTNGDSGHGSDDDITFLEGPSQSPRTLKLGMSVPDNQHYSGHRQSPRSMVSFTKQPLKIQNLKGGGQTPRPDSVPADRCGRGHNRTYSPLVHSVSGNIQNVPMKTNPQYSYRQYLRSPHNPSVSNSLEVSSGHSHPSMDSSRSVTFPTRPLSQFQSHSNSRDSSQLPYCPAVQTSPGSDDETTTSGSYSITLDDIKADLHDVGVRKTTDAYV
ncbi:protocadherin-1-like [Gigantopelta aegis]|uniref:protocadherin-1-like n=1 Tax=Gigantopelta aegis TaxID=1735272 RepID=UPI001B887DB0|nr:protocadherin-1-like [Gigantopelta aegis]